MVERCVFSPCLFGGLFYFQRCFPQQRVVGFFFFLVSFFYRCNCLIPSQRVLCHDWRTYQLGPVASQTARRQTATGSKRGTSTTAFALLLRSRAGPLVQLTLLAVATSHPEHTSTVRGSTTNHTNTNTNRAGTSRRAAAGTTISVVIGSVASVITVVIAAGSTAHGRATSSTGRGSSSHSNRNRRVNHRHERFDCRAGLLVEPGVGVVQLLFQLIHSVNGDISHGNRRNVARVRRVVVGLDGEHRNLITKNIQSVSETLRDVKEDL